ncbi:unnamed protein product, partial [Ectocarpus sp. 12 AP-2014]
MGISGLLNDACIERYRARPGAGVLAWSCTQDGKHAEEKERRSVPAPYGTTSGVRRGARAMHATASRRERSTRSGRACGGEEGAGAG